ncbi:hypothetical protein [Blastococcus deserti]|uniref:Uncharacterized protein n=1 Tax=Blastococcus deserti TaxID=2259033 RepID=A0ABW4X4S8_9ACTN
MDIPVTAGPWLVLGLVLGILLAVPAALGALAVRRRRPGADPPASPAGSVADPVDDDLPAFLEFPPGTARAPDTATGGWAALSTAVGTPAGSPPTPFAPRRGSGTGAVLAAMGGTALLLIGAAAAVATARTPDPDAPRSDERPASATPRAVAVDARLVFEGVVLERHAVGVTVAYPRVRVRTDGDRAAAEIELPTFNCLRTDAPEDPRQAGCTPSVPEYGALSGPDLHVSADGGGLLISGRFAATRRQTGSPPEPTGRAYDVTVRAAPRDGRAGPGQEPATGLLHLGDERVPTSAGEPSTITYGR